MTRWTAADGVGDRLPGRSACSISRTKPAATKRSWPCRSPRSRPITRTSTNYTDLPPIVVEQIEHFFTHYKDLEAEKWVRVGKWGDAEAARQAVLKSIELANAEKAHA